MPFDQSDQASVQVALDVPSVPAAIQVIDSVVEEPAIAEPVGTTAVLTPSDQNAQAPASHLLLPSPAITVKDVTAMGAVPPLSDVTRAFLTAQNGAVANLSIKNIDLRTLPTWLEVPFSVFQSSFVGKEEEHVLFNWITLECEDEGKKVRRFHF